MKQIYLEEIMQDHIFAKFDFSVLRIVEYVWENTLRDQLVNEFSYQKSIISQYMHDELKIIRKFINNSELFNICIEQIN